jgi:hypothetical protein
MQTAWLVYFGALGAGGLRPVPQMAWRLDARPSAFLKRNRLVNGIFDLPRIRCPSDSSAAEESGRHRILQAAEESDGGDSQMER